MKDIEKMLKNVANEEIQVPAKIHYKIQNTLKEKNKKQSNISIKKLVTSLASVIIVLVGGISVYASFGGTILGRPVFEFAKMKFLSEYEEYKVNVQDQQIAHKETTLELVSSICDEYYVLLEFDMKFSEEDKKLLKLGEKYITEKDFENAEQIEDEMTKQWKLEHYEEYKNDINTFYVEFQEVCIDSKPAWPGKTQTVEKISDYEYKVYHIFFLTEQNWSNKNEMDLTLKRCFINTATERVEGNHTKNGTLHMDTLGSGGYFYMDKEINVNISKERAQQNTETIIAEANEIKYKNMTKKVEQIEITPMQIVAKISTKINNVSLESLECTWHKDYIGITDFEVYDDKGEKLTSTNLEIKRTVTYEDGKVEHWGRGDIGTCDSFYNATMELEEIIIIEKKTGINSLKIVPTVQEIIWKNGRNERMEQQVELTQFNIVLDSIEK